MAHQSVLALLLSLSICSTALAAASDQGCASSKDNASGCIYVAAAPTATVLEAPAPLADPGVLGLAVCLSLAITRIRRNDRAEPNSPG